MEDLFYSALLIGLLKMLFTVALVFGAVMILLRYYFSKIKKPTGIPVSDDGQKIILPLRLQAYERIVLFLERIMLPGLVMRLNSPELTSDQLQSMLVKTIREEFEYNLSQQLYISSKAWELVKNAKEQTIHMINLAAGKVSENTSSAELVRQILALTVKEEKSPVSLALEEVKQEVQKSFR